MKYVTDKWPEPRGDKYSNWGSCTYYFEVNPDDNAAMREVVAYQNGNSTIYDRENRLSDIYGFLVEGEVLITETTSEISKEDFEKMWQNSGVIDGVSQW